MHIREARLREVEVLGPAIHFLDEHLLLSGKHLEVGGESHCRVVSRRQHEAVEEVSDAYLIPFQEVGSGSADSLGLD